ncbi:Outer membrane efflux protein [Oleispira antarctica RB-8]|uniref:Outer membrane efflux protein n=1 Tax=Oleispira antarctica RB-8 TaxID=698738 RepID=R4YU84_OLEAN|nr:Outer membrane efflux protein [Oleispira antarctica RB-8]
MNKIIALTSVISSALFASNIMAADLNEIYQLSLANDSELAAAKAKRDAGNYQVDLARAALLPQVSIGATKVNSETEIDGGSTSDIDALSYNATISQTLFNLNSWYNYKAASAGGNATGLEYALSEQQLILRSAGAYFDVLRAKENLDTARAEEKAVKRQLEQTEQRFEVGLIAITEVHEAEASYDLSYANLIGREASLDISYEFLEQITGQRFENLAQLKTDVEFSAPKKAANEWVEAGLGKYAGIQLAQEGVNAAEYTRKAGWSTYAPEVNAQWSYTDGEQVLSSTAVDSTTTSLVLTATIPLFAGGSNYARAKQAAARSTEASANLDLQQRTVKNNIRSLYRKVQTDVLTVKARNRATVSSQSALEATETGYQVGTRNIVEVLNAQRNVFSAQRDYANARYDYIINLLNLKFFAGSLDEADIQALNAWLK